MIDDALSSEEIWHDNGKLNRAGIAAYREKHARAVAELDRLRAPLAGSPSLESGALQIGTSILLETDEYNALAGLGPHIGRVAELAAQYRTEYAAISTVSDDEYPTAMRGWVATGNALEAEFAALRTLPSPPFWVEAFLSCWGLSQDVAMECWRLFDVARAERFARSTLERDAARMRAALAEIVTWADTAANEAAIHGDADSFACVVGDRARAATETPDHG